MLVASVFRVALGLLTSATVAIAISVSEGASAETCANESATMVGDDSNNNLSGTSGQDVIVAKGVDDDVDGLGGHDSICGNEGGDRRNYGLKGGQDWDTIEGGPGSDFVRGNHERDFLYGGDGADDMNGGENGSGTLEQVWGEGGNDDLWGDGGDDWIVAEEGDDVLLGEAGDDELSGGSGFDMCYGGAGIDLVTGGCEYINPG